MKRIHYNVITLLIGCLLWGPALYGQEVLTGKTGDRHSSVPRLKAFNAGQGDTLNLPFIDDFARGVGDPAPELWSDNEAFVNHQYPYNPPSIGVATLDAIDATGDLPPNAGVIAYQSDELTSRPFYMEVEPADSMYLSFYYQSGGRGDTSGGEFQDSLVLQFFAPGQDEWRSAWNAAYSQEDSLMYERYPLEDIQRRINTGATGHRRFFQALVPVKRPEFLKDGFRFRFLNYASLSPNDQIPSIRGNTDHWHIDFVRLDTARTHDDTIIRDIAFVKPLQSMMVNYESIPWSHYPDANPFEMQTRIPVTYRNLGDIVLNVSRQYEIIDRLGDDRTRQFTGGGGDDIPPYTMETYPGDINYSFPYDNRQDSALFEIRSYLVTDTTRERAAYRWNDTLRYFQKFYNYYAYDDGTAENGYGITGEGSQNVMVAMKFYSYTPDTLQAVQIYFNRALDDASQGNFNLQIRADDAGMPGQILYEQENVRPVYEDSLNAFHTYVLDEKIQVEGTFYVGYQKFSTGMLNMGFDVNRVNNDRLYYNLYGNWTRSQIKGTLMIRPVFGPYMKPTGTSTREEPSDPSKPRVDLYPNPVREHLHVDLEKDRHANYTYSVYDIQGRMIIRERRLTPVLSLHELSPGMYIVKLRHTLNQTVISRRIVITP
ncbi:MAG TPA: T9SS type A sorting domain-containing protein [Bacteroidales bacterium]|nr:T9SS type A sorting domain-containing protein [Bacteroidales bacterium]